MKQQELKTKILNNLSKCTTPQIDIFKRMYPCNDNNASLQEYINNIPTNKLEWAYKQIINTIEINQKKSTEETLQKTPPTKNKSYRINTKDTSIIRLYTHEVLDENNQVVYQGISYEKCQAYIELEELQR